MKVLIMAVLGASLLLPAQATELKPVKLHLVGDSTTADSSKPCSKWPQHPPFSE